MKIIGFVVKDNDIQTKHKNRRNRRNERIFILLIIFILIVLLITFLINLIVGIFVRKEDANIKYIGDIPVYQDFLPKTSVARTGEKRKILYIVIHETDNINKGANAKAHNNFIHNNGVENELSWHYTVDDKEIWHHIPDDETAFHAGDKMKIGGGNKNGIGVELCVNSDGDYEKTLENAQILTAVLLYEYDLKIGAVKKHEDFSGKKCPANLIKSERWEEFIDNVEENLKNLKEQENKAQEGN